MKFAGALLLIACLLPSPALASDTGWASEYGPGNSVAMNFCTWSLRHTAGCGSVRITSLDTGRSVTVPVGDWCYCVVPGSPHSFRVVDLQYGVVGALGLDVGRGLFEVRVERVGAGPKLPNTSTLPSQKDSR